MKKLIEITSLMRISFCVVTLICCALPFSSNAQHTKLLDLSGAGNGSSPQGSLVSDGIFLYGMTFNGGVNDLGTIFKIKPNGSSYTKLLDFDGATNGSNPYGSTLISDGTFLYGMTNTGGANDSGTIFKIKPDGTGYSKLLDFSGSANGSSPRGSLISDGTFLYGTTYRGGANDSGTVFKIKPDGTGYLKLLDFSGFANGSYPLCTLISDGTFLYGATYNGGANYLGTIFKIKPDGIAFSTLLNFSGVTDGSYPLGSLYLDGTFLYGTTYQGGTNNLGTIFKIKPNGTSYSKLLDYAGITNGSYPFCSFISDGTFLYGMTFQGGINDLGTLFKIMPDGTSYSKMLDFAGSSNGTYPVSSLITDNIYLYGMTSGGGTNDLGTIFNYALPAAITAVTPSSLNICTGSNIAVSYTTGGVFNAGNLFIAQLSDAAGNFAAPVNLDTLPATSSGTITCTIPSNTPGGAGYRIRMVSTNPAIISNDNGTNIVVNVTPVITTIAPASRCDSGTVNLGAAANAGTLDWYAASSGGSSLGTGTVFTTPSLTLTTVYYVSAGNNGCESARTAVTATVTVITATTPASRCDVGTVTLGATASAGILNWYASSSGGSSLGSGISFTTPSISSTTPYYVDATYASCTTVRTAVTATVNPLPVITTSGNTTICTGSNTILTVSGGMLYSWNPTGETTTAITVNPTATTTYTVTVSDGNSCSDTAQITVIVDQCTGTADEYIERSVIIYPNPFISSATVVLQGFDIQASTSMILFDVFGKELRQVQIVQEQFNIWRDELPAGIYYYRLNGTNGSPITGKIVIE